MKKIASIFTIVLLFASCTKELDPQENPISSPVTVSASFSEFGTKTVTDLDNVTKWVTGDVITITDNGTDKTYQYMVKEGGSATAEFVPVDERNVLAEAGSYDLSAVYEGGVASEQTNSDGRTSAAPLSATFSGAAENGRINLVFGQDASLISFSFVDAKNGKAPLKLSELVIESIGGEEIADGSTTITVTPEGEATSTYQTVVSKVALSKGLLVKATTAEAAASASDGTAFPAGTEYCKIIKQSGADLSTDTGVHATVTVLLNQQGISSKNDLVSFGYMLENKLSVSNYIGGTYNNSGHNTPKICVLNDIDMGGTENTPIDWHPIGQGCKQGETLRYYFDGNYHNIYNFNVKTDARYFGLFGDVYDVTYWGGQIVNLNLGTRDGETWDGVSKIFYESDDDKDEGGKDIIHYVGTFIGRVKKNSSGNGNWLMNNCKNFVPIEISEYNWAVTYVGGLISNASRVQFKNCKNYGDITNNSSKSGMYIGGFAGVVLDKLTQKFENCENHGDITINQVGTLCVGGIVSRYIPADPENNNVNNLTGCTNYGDIKIANFASAIKVGGIIGLISSNGTYPVTFTNCKNEGSIDMESDRTGSAADFVIVGGIAGRGEAPVTYDGCINSGNISYYYGHTSGKAGCRIGGIFGDTTNMDSDCSNCENNGNITFDIAKKDKRQPENYCLGGIAGRISESTGEEQDGSVILECTNSGEVVASANRGAVGGIVGAMADGRLISCSNENIVELHDKSADYQWSAAGGIVGDVWAPAKEITNCTNSGDVLCCSYLQQTGAPERACYAGGIAGWTEEDTIVISGCENTGEVKGTCFSKNSSSLPLVGGIIGYKESSTTDYDNINRGDIIGLGTNYGSHACAGGVVGALHYGTIESCWNYGSVEAGEKKSQWDGANFKWFQYAGSIAGWYNSTAEDYLPACEGTITNCYAGGAVKGRKTLSNPDDGTTASMTTLTSSNWTGLIVGCGTDPTDCHFLDMSDQPVSVLYWNIQNGMCADQVNEYSNFNSWVASQTPDICVWCEAAKVYKNSGEEQGYNTWTGERTIPSFSYGHSNTICPFKKTDYPNMVTLRSGLTATGTKSIDDGNESEGTRKRTIYTKVVIGGKEINLVVVHLSKDASDTEHEALAEIRTILKQTVEKSSDSQSEYWMIIGDFNAICQRDDELPGSPYSSWTNDAATKKPKALSFAVINEVLNHPAGFKDCIAEKNPGQFVSTRYYEHRIDYVFCNPKLYNCLESIEVATVDFGNDYGSFTLGSLEGLRSPSDHRPIKVKFTI